MGCDSDDGNDRLCARMRFGRGSRRLVVVALGAILAIAALTTLVAAASPTARPSASAPTPRGSAATARHETRDEQHEARRAFGFDDVAQRARHLADKPFEAPKVQVPEWLGKITYDQWRDI